MVEWFGENRFVVYFGIAVVVLFGTWLRRRARPKPREVAHDYFDKLWLWPPGSHTRWEAEIRAGSRGAQEVVGFHSETTHDEIPTEGPTDDEVAFCRRWMDDPDALFELTRPAVEEGWKSWFKDGKPMPSQWRGTFTLDGFSVPKRADVRESWGVTWVCEPAGHYFCIDFEKGVPKLTSIDG